MIFPKEAQSTAAIAAHYDELDSFYREIWGEHVHHGYWVTGRERPEAAAEALVEQLAERLALSPGMAVCDIGCGYGLTAQRLAEGRGVDVTGVTVSSVQAARAQDRRPARGALTFQVQDWLSNSFIDASFDRAYSVESSEHMPDKARFFSEAMRVLKPGGRLVVFVWLAREGAKAWEVDHLLEPICREGRLPGMGTEAEYRALAEGAGFAVLSSDDVSGRVAKTWWVCIRRGVGKVLSQARYRRFVLDSHAGNRVFALTLIRIMAAYATGSMRYSLMVFRKAG